MKSRSNLVALLLLVGVSLASWSAPVAAQGVPAGCNTYGIFAGEVTVLSESAPGPGQAGWRVFGYVAGVSSSVAWALPTPTTTADPAALPSFPPPSPWSLLPVWGGDLADGLFIPKNPTNTAARHLQVTTNATPYAGVLVCPVEAAPVPTSTSTNIPTSTNTPLPTSTRTATVTRTPANTATSTNTPPPTSTWPPSPTRTSTPLPPPPTRTSTVPPTWTPPPTWPPPPTAVPPTVTPTYAPTAENPPGSSCVQYNLLYLYSAPGTVVDGSVIRHLEGSRRLQVRGDGGTVLATLGLGETWYSYLAGELQFTRETGTSGDLLRFEICSPPPPPGPTSPPTPTLPPVTNTPGPGGDPCTAADPDFYEVYTIQIDTLSYAQVPLSFPHDFLVYKSGTYPADSLYFADGPPPSTGFEPPNILAQLSAGGVFTLDVVIVYIYYAFSEVSDSVSVISYCALSVWPSTATPTITNTPTSTAAPGSDPTAVAADTATAVVAATETTAAQSPTVGPPQLTATAHHDLETATAEAATGTPQPIPQPQPLDPTGRAGGLWDREPFHSARVYMGGAATAVTAFRDATPSEFPETCSFTLPSMPDGMPGDELGVVDVDQMGDTFCDLVDRSTWLRRVTWAVSTLLILLLLALWGVKLMRRGISGGA